MKGGLLGVSEGAKWFSKLRDARVGGPRSWLKGRHVAKHKYSAKAIHQLKHESDMRWIEIWG